ncbi:hypothetical protein [Streptomyces sp. OP7]|uniref:hypothetical protein n=1 Tax=Streptomyces sp. OP7 TaxID=3142462 RepID=UPI0032E8DD52
MIRRDADALVRLAPRPAVTAAYTARRFARGGRCPVQVPRAARPPERGRAGQGQRAGGGGTVRAGAGGENAGRLLVTFMGPPEGLVAGEA